MFCPAIDCLNVNSIGLGKYRADAGNPEKQYRYFNKNKKR